MTQEIRYKRWRLLVRTLNRQRKKQAQQIDILCNDLIGAQRDFIRRLGVIEGTASLYQALLGQHQLTDILSACEPHIARLLPEARIALGLATEPRLELLIAGAAPLLPPLEQSFDTDMITQLCHLSQDCGMDELLGLGLQVNPTLLADVQMVSLPLHYGCRSVGFLLLTRRGTDPFTTTELAAIRAITGGLAQALDGCRVASGTASN